MAEPAKKAKKKSTKGRKSRVSAEAKNLARVLEEGLFAMHFQPIVDLRSRSIFAYESLCRPQDGYFKSPVALIDAAVKAERIGELGRMQRIKAVKSCGDYPLFVNLEPHEFDEPWLVRPDDPIFMHRHPVYLEITENVPLKYFEQCHSVVGELRKKGTHLVIDDFGAGFSNFKYIAELEPDVVKLDRELVRECRLGTSEFHLLKSITQLCHQMNARVVAEGIETLDELEAVLGAGIDYGQGYLLARPSAEPSEIDVPASDWPPLAPEGRNAEEPDTDDEAAVAAAERERELRAEIEKLGELLIESESGRLTLAKRLREQSQIAATKRKSDDDVDGPDTSQRPQASPKTPPEPKPPAKQRSDETPEAPSATPPAATVAYAASSRSETDRDTIFRYIGYAALPLLLLFVAVTWTLWPAAGDDVTASPNGARVEASVGDPGRPAVEQEPHAGEDPSRLEDASSPVVEASATAPAPDPISEAIAEEPAVESSQQPGLNPSPRSADAAALASQIDSWARAWSEQETGEYVALYSPDFIPPGGRSFRDWVAFRRERIEAPEWIDVEVSDLEISFAQPDFAVARFTQSYSSPGYSDRVVKILEWTREPGGWRILAERTE